MTTTPTVLIIEDDPVFRRVLSFTVAKMGLAVETATDGLFGYERLMQGGIDFMVTDHQMPRCGGVELLQRIKDTAGYTRPPAILCTAKGLELDSELLRREFGLVTIMHKPFSPRKLSELILEYLGDSRLGEPSGDPTPENNPAGDSSNGSDASPIAPLPTPPNSNTSYPPQSCGDG